MDSPLEGVDHLRLLDVPTDLTLCLRHIPLREQPLPVAVLPLLVWVALVAEGLNAPSDGDSPAGTLTPGLSTEEFLQEGLSLLVEEDTGEDEGAEEQEEHVSVSVSVFLLRWSVTVWVGDMSHCTVLNSEGSVGIISQQTDIRILSSQDTIELPRQFFSSFQEDHRKNDIKTT